MIVNLFEFVLFDLIKKNRLKLIICEYGMNGTYCLSA